MENPEDCILFLLAKAYQRGHGILKEHLKGYGLTVVQQLILAAVAQEEGVSAGEIGQKLVLDNATVSGTLDRMSESGWIVKEPDPSDRRVLRISLTPKARTLNKELAAARQLSNDEIAKNLSLEEKVLLKRLLRDLR